MWNCRGTPFPPDFQIHSFIFQFGVFSTLNKIIVFYLWTVIFSAPTINLLPYLSPSVHAASIAMIYYLVVYVSVHPDRLRIPQEDVSFGFFQCLTQ